MNEQEKLIVEQLIDKHGLAEFMYSICHICSLKSDHIKTNWQDGQTAKTWDAATRKLYAVADYLERSPR